MPYISNSPEWWPTIQLTILISSSDAAWFAVAIYDYFIRFDEEVELIWMRPKSLTTLLYIAIRYTAIAWSFLQFVIDSMIPVADSSCLRMEVAWQSMSFCLGAITQVILVLRATALYDNSKKVFAFLFFWFIAEQAVLLTTIVLQLNPSNLFGERFILSGISMCEYSIANISWTTPVNSSVTLAFESLLVVFVAYRLVKHVRASHKRWEFSLGIKSIFAEIVAGNLAYYVVLLLAFTLNAAAPYIVLYTNLSSVSGQAYIVIHTIIGNYVYTMAGPHLILSLRQSHAHRIDGVISGNVETLSDVQFDGNPQVETII